MMKENLFEIVELKRNVGKAKKKKQKNFDRKLNEETTLSSLTRKFNRNLASQAKKLLA